jgi:hypothetical protein
MTSSKPDEPEEGQMNTIPYDTPEAPEEGWEGYEDEGEEFSPPGRPRRQFFNRWSALLLALILGAIGFYAGVRVEKSQVSNSTSTAGSAVASRLAALGGARAGTRAGAGAGSSAAGAAGASGSSGAAGAGGGAGLRALLGGGGGAPGGGSASFGTVSSIDGNTLYITETSGNTVKVTLSSATKMTKNVTVGKKAVRPGDAVVVSGAKSSDGTISAITLSDTGASPTAGAGGGGSSTPTSGRSAVNSLFGGGGG